MFRQGRRDVFLTERQKSEVPESITIGASERGGPVPDLLLDELYQRPVVRQQLIRSIEDHLGGRAVVTFFTSFTYPVIVEDSDADMLESIVQHMDLSKGLCLVLNSPGGDALAAEKIIRVCRAYSNDDFEVMVPKAAKSAATMIALGSDRILMGKTSELGPIDPQVIQQVGDTARYNASEIEEIRQQQKLSADIARRSLQSGMLKDDSEESITKCIRLFTDWEETLTHGRPIYSEAASALGIKVKVFEPHDPVWKCVFELYIRTDQYVSSSQACKTIEAARFSLSVPPPRRPN